VRGWVFEEQRVDGWIQNETYVPWYSSVRGCGIRVGAL
jgi:hypothetical protein